MKIIQLPKACVSSERHGKLNNIFSSPFRKADAICLSSFSWNKNQDEPALTSPCKPKTVKAFRTGFRPQAQSNRESRTIVKAPR